MLDRLKRHPFAVEAHFRRSLVVAHAWRRQALEPLLPAGLVLDTYGEHGFSAIALVQTERLRPAGLPTRLGRDFFLTGYRIFVRVAGKPSLRGLYILRSDADRRSMVVLGNLFTHYRYRLAEIVAQERDGSLAIRVRTPASDADLELVADLSGKPAPFPRGSPFADVDAARRYAGPLPYTFTRDEATSSILSVRATRQAWDPRAIGVDVREATFLRSPLFSGADPVLANAFYVEHVDYRWERGELLPGRARSTRRPRT
jgi:uncharacterized protein YqjF (DUF2071 family)